MSVPNSFAAVSSATGAQLDANFAACLQLNALNPLTKAGDQFSISQDVSLYRTGTWSTIASGAIYTLLGDFAMSYWTHNTAVDSNGNFLGRDHTDTCTFGAFTEGGLIKVYTAVTGGAGVVPVWTLVYTLDTATGNITVLGNILATGTVTGSNTSSSISSPVRQTVLAGAAAIVQIGTGLSCNLLATATPVRIAYPGGMGANGAIDYVGSTTVDQASFWSGLTANVTNYLFADRNTSTGAQTGITSPLAYVVQLSGGTVSVVNGQHTYEYDTGVMWVGNGTSASIVQRTVIGECVAGASTISSVITYAHQRTAITPFIAGLPLSATKVVFNTAIGTKTGINVHFEIECTANDNGYVIGDIIFSPKQMNNGAGATSLDVIKTPNTVSVIMQTGFSLWAINPTTGANNALTAASWKMRAVASSIW